MHGNQSISLGDLADLRVCCILDPFSYDTLAPECKLRQLTPAGWQAELVRHNPHMLLVESAWQGKNNSWRGRFYRGQKDLGGILSYCRENGILTVFWNKEDPLHFCRFLFVAQEFDWVFTTDLDCVPHYKALLGHERVGVLPFFVQPRLHNPLFEYNRQPGYCFAGSYYETFSARCKQMNELFNAILKTSALAIYDRNLGDEAFKKKSFPANYMDNVKGRLDYKDIGLAYKGYEGGITINTVTDSPTMFARRAVELLCSNTTVIGNYCKALRFLFGDAVRMPSDNASPAPDTRLDYYSLSSFRSRVRAMRHVLTHYTSQMALRYLVNEVLGTTINHTTMDRVLVIAVTRDELEQKRMQDLFDEQTYAHKDICFETGHQHKIGGENRYGWLSLWHPTHYYGPHYLEDLMNARSFSPVPIICKQPISWSIDQTNTHVVETAYRVGSLQNKYASVVRADSIQMLDESDSQALILDPFEFAPDLFRSEAMSSDLKAIRAHSGALRGRTLVELRDLARGSSPCCAVINKDYAAPGHSYLKQCIRCGAGLTASYDENSGRLIIQSELQHGIHKYVNPVTAISLPHVMAERTISLLCETEPKAGVNRLCMHVGYYLSHNHELTHCRLYCVNHPVQIIVPPDGTAISISFRIEGPGTFHILGIQSSLFSTNKWLSGPFRSKGDQMTHDEDEYDETIMGMKPYEFEQLRKRDAVER